MPSHRSTSGNDPVPPFGPSAHPRGGSASLLPRRSALGCLKSVACAEPTMPSADFYGAVREDGSALSPLQDTLQISRGQPSYRRCRDAGLIKHSSTCGWRAWLSRASSPRAYHTSYPVRVPRPAHAFHTSFGPHLAVTPLRFPCPSAPRTPGQGTFTPEHDRMHGTHASGERRSLPRPLHRFVSSLGYWLRCGMRRKNVDFLSASL